MFSLVEAKQELAESERQWLQELDEEECRAFPDEMKRLIVQHRQRPRLVPVRHSKDQVQQKLQDDLKEPQNNEPETIIDTQSENLKDTPTDKFMERNMVNLCYQYFL